jgi:MinD-like ATPase involved in chromosome partitioning or flagellar assembly
LAVNLAAELTVRGHRVLLVDADPYGGAIAARLGLLDETPGFAAVCRLADQELLTRSEFDRIAQRADVNGHELFVLSGILRPDRWPELSAARVTAAIETCQRFCDVMIIDVGFNLESDEEISSDLFSPRRNTATLSAMAAATTLVTVADSDVVGLARFLRSSAEVAKLFPGARLLTVANKVRSSVAGFAPGTQVRQTLERFGGLVDIALVPHDDKAFDACSLRAAPLCLVAPKSAARRAIVELALKCAAPATRSVAAKTRGFRSRRSAQHPD